MRNVVVFLLALLLAACASVKESPDNKVAKNFQVPDHTKKVLVLPLKMDNPAFVAGGPLIEQQLHAQLKQAGYETIELNPSNYNDVWNQEVAAVGGLYDPQNGHVRPDAYARALHGLVMRVMEQVDCSMVLVPNLILKKVTLSDNAAEWDGVGRVLHTTDASLHLNGEQQGLSLRLTAFNHQGEWQFTTFGGIALPYLVAVHLVAVHDAKLEVRDDLFSRPAQIEEAVTLALHPLTNTKSVN